MATRRIAALLEQAGPADLVLCLISGGGSALMTVPAPGISLADVQVLTGALLACGASIHEINTLRKHIDLVKGGGLAGWAALAALPHLILSDVVGDPLDVIASGPLRARFQHLCRRAWLSSDGYDLLERVPPSIRSHLEAWGAR